LADEQDLLPRKVATIPVPPIGRKENPVHQLRVITILGALAATVLPVAAIDISGAGATFPYPLYSKWADAFKKETGVGLNYQSIGSGGGIKQIEAKTVTFGATDAPLKGPELDKFGLVQFPMVMGGIVPVFNIDGIASGELVLDGPTLAGIFLGTVKTWDAPAIKKLNPNAKLPSQAIAVVHRSDGSGTTFNFAYYLSAVSPEWKSNVGSATSVESALAPRAMKAFPIMSVKPRGQLDTSSTLTRSRIN
jgi:phosphate transport system substrate-binding protein